ncbi:glycoside hydrolase family 43 protein [Hymenobacter sp. GOD-10R]|uniref:glycoside hydrolase family 43 protein n=1 Tax=Hymenobacter sp. GOD-10R TaxID=3093922 RepID=UPI002D778E8B|nr:glycoside hydrolase family 43 protein [Hymenobacter sp. GOD-10R]WRQ28537.1 glycoside hydrolase family 43 protein [Hymenobacter sp. GOD-10R]
MRKLSLTLLALGALAIQSTSYADGPAKNLAKPRAPKAEKNTSFRPGELWYDTDGNVINAHGGGILLVGKIYYWYGEKRAQHQEEGVNVYSSKDLYNWKYEGVALTPSSDPAHDIAVGCLMERPKVIYNKKTGKYVMWFHLELKGQGYKAARAGVAVADKPTGPFKYVSSFRPNGNMSRDMGLYVDDDGTAYHIYSSKENYDLRLARLNDDYLTPTTQDSMLFSRHREAPALFKKDGKYYLITSGCTGWAPNQASLHVASSPFGPWQLVGDPMSGPNAKLTFDGQSTYVLPVPGKKDAFIFMADRWNPKDLKDSRHLWLPVQFKAGQPTIDWVPQWDLGFFNQMAAK